MIIHNRWMQKNTSCTNRRGLLGALQLLNTKLKGTKNGPPSKARILPPSSATGVAVASLVGSVTPLPEPGDIQDGGAVGEPKKEEIRTKSINS